MATQFLGLLGEGLMVGLLLGVADGRPRDGSSAGAVPTGSLAETLHSQRLLHGARTSTWLRA
jgi:hypothetical protein